MTGLSSMAVRSRRAKVLLYVFIGTCYALLSSLFVSRGSQVSSSTRNREAVLNIVRKKNPPEKYLKKEIEKENSIIIFPKYHSKPNCCLRIEIYFILDEDLPHF
jgi:hypothetical protein